MAPMNDRASGLSEDGRPVLATIWAIRQRYGSDLIGRPNGMGGDSMPSNICASIICCSHVGAPPTRSRARRIVLVLIRPTGNHAAVRMPVLPGTSKGIA